MVDQKFFLFSIILTPVSVDLELPISIHGDGFQTEYRQSGGLSDLY